jgi:hypothetical protein
MNENMEHVSQLYLSGKMWVHTGIVKTGDIVKYR